jgi:hypothetical protein
MRDPVRAARLAAVTGFLTLAPALNEATAAAICPGAVPGHPLPMALQTEIAQVFEVAPEATRFAALRCDGAKLLACVTGANLNCGKADTRTVLPATSAFCRAHPNANVIPMAFTGHATIYARRCVGAHPTAEKATLTVDAHGYVTQNWKEIQ